MSIRLHEAGVPRIDVLLQPEVVHRAALVFERSVLIRGQALVGFQLHYDSIIEDAIRFEDTRNREINIAS